MDRPHGCPGGDSVSQIEEDSGWQDLWSEGSQFVRYRRLGRVVHLWWIYWQEDTAYWECPTPLPEGCRPAGNTYASAVLTSSTGYATNNVALACIETDGTVGLQTAASVRGALNRGLACFVAS